MMETTDEKDKLEEIITEVVDNSDVLLSFLPLLKRLKEAGILNLFADISKDYMPTDIEFLGHFFSSREFTYSILKSANLMLSVLYAMADEKVSDTVKNLMFNMRGIMDGISESQKDESPLSLLDIYRLSKDKNAARGIRIYVAVMRAIGEIFERTGKKCETAK